MTRNISRRPLMFVSLLLVVGAVSLLGQHRSVWGRQEADAHDLLQPGTRAGGDVVMVGIDRATLGEAGQPWPWPREQQAKLLAAIADTGPRTVAYDVVLAHPQAGDPALVAAMSRTPTVIASAMTLRPKAGDAAEVLDAVEPDAELEGAAVAVGHANVSVAPSGGVVRELPMFVRGDRRVPIPSLALAAVAAFDGASPTIIERPDGVQINDRLIPLDDGGELRINWSADLSADDIIPAREVLRGEASDRLRGKLVVVGVTEPTLGDLHLVPIDRSGSTPGIVVHANAINTILTRAYLDDRGGLPGDALVIAAIALALAAFVWLRLSFATGALVIVIAAVWAFGTWRFHAAGELWPVAWPTLGPLLAAAGATAWRYATEIRHRRRAWALFSTYVPETVVQQLADPAKLEEVVEGQRLDVAVVFCDLRGFTPVAATLEPADVRRLLDHYYDYAVGIVHRHRGTVMQFVGDEVFAVFGAPLSWSESIDDAVRCARTLQDDVRQLDAVLRRAGLPSIRFGVSVHSGPVVAAHVGSSDRRQYAVIGDTVNVGSRLCGQAAAGEVVLSERVVAALDGRGNGFIASEPLELKGVAAPMPVYRYRTPLSE